MSISTRLVSFSVFVGLLLFASGCSSSEKKEEPKAAVTNKVESSASGFVLSQSDYRFVKTADNMTMYLIQDGKRTTIASWDWAQAHRKNKPIEVLTKEEIMAIPDTGFIIK